jgi:hypothetical protein
LGTTVTDIGYPMRQRVYALPTHKSRTVARELTFKTSGILGEAWSKWSMVVHDGDGLELFSFDMSTVRNGDGK